MSGENQEDRQIVRDHIHSDDFEEPLLRQLAEKLMPLYEEIHYPTIIDSFEDEKDRKIVAKLLMDPVDNSEPHQTVIDCVKTLKIDPIKKKIQDVRLKIRNAESESEDITPLIVEITQLQEELKSIKG